MQRNRPALFKGRHFEAEIIVLCVRSYLRFGLSFRNLEEMMAERNLSVDHVTIWRFSVTRQSSTAAVGRNCGIRTGRGESTRPIAEWQASGPIYIVPSIPAVPPSISF
jgi:hypothetical protein